MNDHVRRIYIYLLNDKAHFELNKRIDICRYYLESYDKDTGLWNMANFVSRYMKT